MAKENNSIKSVGIWLPDGKGSSSMVQVMWNVACRRELVRELALVCDYQKTRCLQFLRYSEDTHKLCQRN